MNYFDILLAKKMGGSTPLPANAYLLEEITDGDLTSAKSKPLPSVSVAVTDADELDVFVGDSETIVSDNEPYIYRQSKGGRMVSERLVGASVAWNQLIVDGDFSSTSRWGVTNATISVTDNVATLIPQNTTGLPNITQGRAIETHVYFGSADVYNGESGGITEIQVGDSGAIRKIATTSITNEWTKLQGIGKALSENVNGYFRVIFSVVSSLDVVLKVKNVNVIDLTLMFGSTIADYVYSLEQSTAGAGIAWLKSYGFFSEDYYAYDSGSLKSVSVSEKKVRDASDNVIATYPLPSSDLRGLYKLASNKLYCDGDIQYGDGWRLRRYGIVDLGTIANAIVYNSGYICWVANITELGLAKFNGNNIIPNVFDNKGFSATYFYASKSDNKITVSNTGYLLIGNNSDYVKPDNIIVYELATPIWEKTNLFTNPQTVGSTEEFVANLPVGHESKYYDGDIHHSYIYSGDARAKVTGDVDIVNGTAPNGTCSVCVVMPDGDEIWSDAGDVTAEIWT